MEKKNIFIIGCGGNGSWFIYNLIHGSSPEVLSSLRKNYRFYLIDHDIVSKRNLQRQNFKKYDVGYFKSLALLRGFDWRNIECYPFTSKNPKIDIIPHGVFIFIDNMKGRKHYYESIYKRYKDYLDFYMDVGNERDFGQIFILVPHKEDNLVSGLYTSYLTSKDDFEGNACGENEQSIYINKLMARVSYLKFKEFLQNNKLNPEFLKLSFNPDENGKYLYNIYNFYLVNGFLITDPNLINIIKKKLTFYHYIFINLEKQTIYTFKSITEPQNNILDIFTNYEEFFERIKIFKYVKNNNEIYYFKSKGLKLLKNGENVNKEGILDDIIKKIRLKPSDKKTSFHFNDLDYIKLKFLGTFSSKE